jgi:hypothetical protein
MKPGAIIRSTQYEGWNRHDNGTRKANNYSLYPFRRNTYPEATDSRKPQKRHIPYSILVHVAHILYTHSHLKNFTLSSFIAHNLNVNHLNEGGPFFKSNRPAKPLKKKKPQKSFSVPLFACERLSSPHTLTLTTVSLV